MIGLILPMPHHFNKLKKPQQGEINIARGISPGKLLSTANYADKRIKDQYRETQWRNANDEDKQMNVNTITKIVWLWARLGAAECLRFLTVAQR